MRALTGHQKWVLMAVVIECIVYGYVRGTNGWHKRGYYFWAQRVVIIGRSIPTAAVINTRRSLPITRAQDK